MRVHVHACAWPVMHTLRLKVLKSDLHRAHATDSLSACQEGRTRGEEGTTVEAPASSMILRLCSV